MFVSMLTVHYFQNNSYEITINDYKARKINEKQNKKLNFRSPAMGNLLQR